MTLIKPLSHGEIENFLLQLTILLVVAYGFGRIAKQWKQPALIGNIVGGILLGPTILGHWLPDLQLLVFKPEQAQTTMLSAIAWVGLLLFLMEAGIDVNLNVLRRTGKQTFWVAGGGLVIPLVAGFALGSQVPDYLLNKPSDRLALSLFLAVSMSISALPPISMVLREKNMIRHKLGQIALGAAMVDDVVAWVLVAVMSSLYLTGHFDALSATKSTSAALIFIGISYVLGRPLMRRLISWHNGISPGASAQLSVLILFGISGSLITNWLGLEFALGIFVVGILIGSVPSLQKNAVHALGLIISSFLAPLYFGLAGLRLNLWSVLDNWGTFNLLVAVLLIAFFSKFLGIYLGARAGGLSLWERITLGFGMNARGGTEIVIATMAMSIGLLSKEIYSIIVVMAMFTVIFAVPLMSWAMAKVAPEEELTDPSAVQFIYEEALADPHTALDAVENEEVRLAKKLKGYCLAMRTATRPEDNQVFDNILEPFKAVALSIESFQEKIAAQTLCPGTSSQLIRLQKELALLCCLEDSLRQLSTSVRMAPQEGPFGQHFSTYVDGLDSILDAMIEALSLKDSASRTKFSGLIDGREPFLNQLRSDCTSSDDPQVRVVLFQIAHGFEQTLWLFHMLRDALQPSVTVACGQPNPERPAIPVGPWVAAGAAND